MRNLLALSVLFSSLVSAQTVINYEDGSTYTLAGDEQIYIAAGSSALHKKKDYSNGSVYFTTQKPWSKRDYVPEPQDEFAVGSHGWCKEYAPWSEGLTFNMISWQRYCDTNGDGQYDENDLGWEG
jgi:hypothetical protein|tara:strand:- start:752 stop:1126 length:375 start_codon:yes stop_codon:yes gene_type:complete